MTVKLVKRRSTHDVHHLEPIVGIILAVSFVTIARPRRRAVVASNLPFVFALARVLRRHVPVRRASPPTRPSPSRPRRRHHLEIDPTLRSERARPRRRPTRQRARGFGVSKRRAPPRPGSRREPARLGERREHRGEHPQFRFGDQCLRKGGGRRQGRALAGERRRLSTSKGSSSRFWAREGLNF